MLNGTLMTHTSGGTAHVVGARLRFVATARVAGSALPPVYPVATHPRQAADETFDGTNAPIDGLNGMAGSWEVALGTAGIIGVGLVGKKRCKRS